MSKECEACKHLATIPTSVHLRDIDKAIIFSVNQHHTCKKEDKTMKISWIQNCFIKYREGETKPLFTFDGMNKLVSFNLDGYAIIPHDEYLKLLDYKKLHGDTPRRKMKRAKRKRG